MAILKHTHAHIQNVRLQSLSFGGDASRKG